MSRRVAHPTNRVVVTMAVAAATFASLGCGPGGRYVDAASYPHTQSPPIRENVIRVGDTLNVRVFGQEPMSTRGKVRPEGTLALPLLGEYPVAGKHPSTLADELEKRLAPFVASPHVTVVVEESPVRITVIGELRRNAVLKMEWPVTLVDALAEAGGLTEFADESAIFVLRGNQRIRFEYEDVVRGTPHARAFVMQTGDVIVVE